MLYFGCKIETLCSCCLVIYLSRFMYLSNYYSMKSYFSTAGQTLKNDDVKRVALKSHPDSKHPLHLNMLPSFTPKTFNTCYLLSFSNSLKSHKICLANKIKSIISFHFVNWLNQPETRRSCRFHIVVSCSPH